MANTAGLRRCWPYQSLYAHLLDGRLCLVNHLSPVGGDGGGDGDAGQLAHGRTRETVDGVGTDLECQLPPVLHCSHLRELPCRDQ